MKGLHWALLSVLLVSGAQLLLRDGMLSLPPLADLRAFLLALLLGLMGYVASMGCWYLALHRMALSKAYALLSLSYILVWAAAIWLPGWHEPFTLRGAFGVALIVAGVLVIFLPARNRA